MSGAADPIAGRVAEAKSIIAALDFPRAQRNERTGRVLLALLGLTPNRPWTEATNPLLGIRGIADFIRTHYDVDYAENTRETIRDESVRPLLNAGLIVPNPDQPDRPVTSPNFRYQIETSALALLRTYGTDDWEANLEAYRATRTSLMERYARERAMTRIPVTLPEGGEVFLSAGGQNVLIAAIINEFGSRFTPGGRVLYIGDAADKWKYLNREALEELGVTIWQDSKIPDVIIHHTNPVQGIDRLVLIEAVATNGPISGQRYEELMQLFAGARDKTRLVFVTAFATRQAMRSFLAEMSWEAEVWFADEPTHLLHWNGEQFLRSLPGEEERN